MNILNLNEEIYVQISFLEKYGLNQQTIYNGLSRNRSKNSRSYEHFPDPKDKRIKWIKYVSLPNQLFKKYKLPLPFELKNTLQEKKRSNKEELVHRCLHFANERGFYEFKKIYHGVFHDHEAIDKYSRTHAVFKSALDLRSYEIDVKDIFPVYRNIEDLVFHTDSLKSFYHKLKEFDKKGAAAFIHKSYKRANSKRKVTEEHLKTIEKLYRNPKIFSGRQIHQKLNEWAILKGYSLLSISTIKQILSDTSFQNKNKGYRYGEEWIINNYEPFYLRLNPEHNGTLWQIDGSRLQIPYLGKQGKPRFLVLFVVMDVHSRKIVGCSFGETENHKLVIRALKSAVSTTNYVPKEMLRDNGKCFEHEKYKYIEEYLGFLGCYVRRHKVGLARDKAQVERFFSTFQTTVLNQVDGYIGEGIKSRREEGRPAKKELKKFLHRDNLRTRRELEKLIPKLIDQYNSQTLSDNYSPNVRFEIAKNDPLATNVSENEFALMFWDYQTKQVKNSMICMTAGRNRNKEYQYIIYDNDLRLKYQKDQERLKVRVVVCISNLQHLM